MYYYIYAGGQEDRHLASGLLEEYYRDMNQQCGEIYTQLVALRTKKPKLPDLKIIWIIISIAPTADTAGRRLKIFAPG